MFLLCIADKKNNNINLVEKSVTSTDRWRADMYTNRTLNYGK